MARINTNVASLIAQQNLASSQKTLDTTLQRLSTGLRINSGADDPAGLIASEGLKSEIAGINQAVSNSTQANNVIATAEGALGEVSSLLLNIKSLVVASANTGALSQSEIQANQLQIDSAVQNITRISNTTSFDGENLIDGSLNYVTSGVSTTALTSVQISQANFGTTGAAIPVNVNVITSARPAELTFSTSQIASSVTIQIAGTAGVQVLTFASGTHASAVAFAVNQVSDSTGVSATFINAAHSQSGLVFNSEGYGSKNFVSVTTQKGGPFVTDGANGTQSTRATGVDAVATINGAVTVGDGLDVQLNNGGLDIDLSLAKNFGAGQTNFAITGGGANFQLGSSVSSAQQVSIGIGSVAASQLGNSNVGFLSDIVTGGSSSVVASKSSQAESIVEQAITQVSELNGRLGAFQQNTLNTNIDSLNIALQNVTASESNITDANFATETSNLTRSQILVQAGTSVLATANNTPQSVLSLLSGH